MVVATSSQPQPVPRLWVAAVALLLAVAVPVVADHVQTDSNGMSVAFDHRGGNEWWVEVVVGSSRGVTQVDVMDDGGAWAPMTYHHDWGAVWAAGYHVEPGHRVMFRTLTAGGDLRTSCWFTHPAGVEQCASTPPPGAFDATFTGVRGNEWWVQANVATNGPAVSKVDVRLNNNGAWGNFMPVTKQSWGWGSSYHVVQGTVVQLRATASDGQTDLSSCRQWIPSSGQDATIVTCPGSGGTTPFEATFTGVKGNEWWVQANVAGNEPISKVFFRIDCAPRWSQLTKQSWGGWAPTYQVHILPGQKVDFMATSADGDVDASGGYIWTAATPAAACALGAWPHEGSQVVYDLSSGVCGGGECFHADATLALTYKANSWEGQCVGETRHTATDGSQTRESFTSRLDILPLFGKLPTSVGAHQDIRTVGVFYTSKSCGISGDGFDHIVQRQETRPTAMVDGQNNPKAVQAWVAERDEVGSNFMVSAFDTRLGLVVEQQSYPRMSQQGSGSLYVTLTDAPLQMVTA